jgi:Uncharacterised protein family (UPF0180)
MKRVAIEASLTPIQEYLSQRGVQCETLEGTNANVATQNQYTAIVISGVDQNMMGMQDVVHNCPVINAKGLTPEEVYQRLQNIPT